MQKIITVIGATAIGKSDFAVKLAKQFNGEIISADSRQIYRKLNLTTGKVTLEETCGIKHHLIDIIDVNTPYSVYNFVSDANKCIDNILSKNKLPIICGGTGLYTRAIVEGFNLEQRDNIDENRKIELEKMSVENLIKIVETNKIEITPTDIKNKRRVINAILKFESGVKQLPNQPQYNVLQICLTSDREVSRARIRLRLKKRIENGMIEEVREVINAGGDKEFLKNLGLEFKHTVMYIDGEYKTFEEYFEKLYTAICQFSKRQVTWFKKEKNCIYLDAFDSKSFDVACKEIQKFLSK